MQKALQDAQKKGTSQDQAVITARQQLADATQAAKDSTSQLSQAYETQATAAAKGCSGPV